MIDQESLSSAQNMIGTGLPGAQQNADPDAIKNLSCCKRQCPKRLE